MCKSPHDNVDKKTTWLLVTEIDDFHLYQDFPRNSLKFRFYIFIQNESIDMSLKLNDSQQEYCTNIHIFIEKCSKACTVVVVLKSMQKGKKSNYHNFVFLKILQFDYF